MYELELFAGGGGGILGGHLLGWQCVGAVEIDAYARSILIARQDDGTLPPFPIWSDVRSFTKRNNQCRHYFAMLRKIRHALVIKGGFPCQDISIAGKGAGIDGERSGLWREFARIIREVRPAYVIVENSPALVTRGLGTVLGDLAALGYDACWGVLGADDAIWNHGDPCTDHARHRLWIVASANAMRDKTHLKRRIDQQGRDAVGRCEQAAFGDDWPASANSVDRQIAPIANTDGAGLSRHTVERIGAQNTAPCRAGVALSDGDGVRKQQPQGADAEERRRLDDGHSPTADNHRQRLETGRSAISPERRAELSMPGNANQRHGGDTWWSSEPAVCRMDDGMAAPMDVHGAVTSIFMGRLAEGVRQRCNRIKCLGNGQVPVCLKLAWETLTELLK